MIKLENYDICVGVIHDDRDELKLGRVKCTSPGLLDNATIEPDNMPWIYPFHMSGYQHFSRPIMGQKVWILRNRKNYNEYWYIPYHEYIDIVEDFLAEHYEHDHPEILVARHSGGMSSMMTYDDVTGFKTSINESYINLKPNGDYDLRTGTGEIRGEGGKIYLGSYNEDPKKYEHGTRGDSLKKILDDLSSSFSNLYKLAIGNPMTQNLAPGFMQALNSCSPSKNEDVIANHVYVN